MLTQKDKAKADRTSAAHMEQILGGDVLFSTGDWALSPGLVQVIKRASTEGIVNVPAVAEPLLVWVVSGEAVVGEREPGGEWERQTVRKGCFYLTLSATPYEMQWRLLPDTGFTVMHLYLDPNSLNEAFQACHHVDFRYGKIQEISGSEDPILNSLFEMCYAEMVDPASRSPAALEAVLQLIAFRIVRAWGSVQQTPVLQRNALPVYRLNKARSWMLAHLSDPFSLAQVAAHCGMSEYHFSRQFKQATGVTPSAWFTAQRIEWGCRLLRETDLSVTDIALEVGYSSHSHFSQVFKKMKAQKPAEYRRR